MPPDETIPLNGPQRLHFEVILASLEEAVSDVEQIALGSAHTARRLKRMENDLPPRFWERAAPHVASLRAHAAMLTSVLGLKGLESSANRTVRAVLTAQAVQIEDSLSSHLRGYGPVDPDVPARLDPALLAIKDDLDAMRALLHAPAGAVSGGVPA
jgi:hypothetical protein